MVMTNAEWIAKMGYKFSDIGVAQPYQYGEFTIYIVEKCPEDSLSLVGKVNAYDKLNALEKWLDAEHKEPILDDAEKRYLRAVIRPFRGSICGIRKIARSSETEMIRIDMKDWDMAFRPFKKGTMYKRMEPNKKYTLEELGL